MSGSEEREPRDMPKLLTGTRVDPEMKKEKRRSPQKESTVTNQCDPPICVGRSEGRPKASIVGGPIVESGLSQMQGETIRSPGERDCDEAGLTVRSGGTDVTLGPRAWKVEGHDGCSDGRGPRGLDRRAR